LKHRGASPDAFAAVFGGVSWFCRSGVSSFLVIERGRVGKNSSGTFTQVAPTVSILHTRTLHFFQGEGTTRILLIPGDKNLLVDDLKIAQNAYCCYNKLFTVALAHLQWRSIIILFVFKTGRNFVGEK
jgi:hypothetical protein